MHTSHAGTARLLNVANAKCNGNFRIPNHYERTDFSGCL